MAGDWIKMRTALADDPAVICMADRLGMEEFSVVGRLHHLWSWADSQSRDGHAVGVTGKWIDRYVQRDGFADAMIAVGWLDQTETGISFPNFERHNGATAKSRGLAKDRKEKQRAGVTPPKGQTSRTERDSSVTREEKRRDIQQHQAPDARQRFEMHEAWQPDEVSLTAQLRMLGVDAMAVTAEVVHEFVGFWMTKEVADSQSGWCHRLVKNVKQSGVRAAAKPAPKPSSGNWADQGVIV